MSNILRFKIYDGRLIQNTDIASTIFQGFANGLDAITLPAWFNKNNKNTKNVTCSFIKIFTNSTSFHYLLWVYSPDALIEGYYDTALNEVRINKMKSVKHCAWYCNDRSTLLRSWEAPVAVNVSPKMRIWNTSCPGDTPGTGPRCYYIYELPTLDTAEALAPKSVNIFNKCIDVPSLGLLV